MPLGVRMSITFCLPGLVSQYNISNEAVWCPADLMAREQDAVPAKYSMKE